MPLTKLQSNGIAAAAVASTALASNAITSAKLAPNAVTVNDIADGSITSAKLASSIETSNISITGGSLSNTPIANAAIAGSSIAGSTIANAVLQSRTREIVTVSASDANGNINFDVNAQQVLIFTSNSTANVTLNIRGNSTVTLDEVMSINESMTIAFAMSNDSNTFYVSAVQIDGVGVTPKYQGGAPTSGTANVSEFYIFNTIKTAANTYLVYGSQTAFE